MTGADAQGMPLRLRVRAPGKVNLCLFVGGLRADGRHQLVTLFESVSLADELEVLTGVALEDQVVCRPEVAGPNIVSRALEGLRGRGWDAPPVKVVIDKRIPIAGGMGGGSADAAATLRVAPRLAPVSGLAIDELAAELGADVPSQLEPGLAIGTGAGERVRRVCALAPHAFVLVPAPVQLATAAVYGEADRLGRIRDAAELGSVCGRLEAALGVEDRLAASEGRVPASEGRVPASEDWPAARERRLPAARERGLPASLLVNDLEHAALSLCPAIRRSIEAVIRTGADPAVVCGSGPTVAGLYWGADGGRRAAAAADALRGGGFPAASSAVPVEAEFGFALFA